MEHLGGGVEVWMVYSTEKIGPSALFNRLLLRLPTLGSPFKLQLYFYAYLPL